MEKQKTGNVEIVWNHTLEEIVGDVSGVTGARIKSVNTEQESDLSGSEPLDGEQDQQHQHGEGHDEARCFGRMRRESFERGEHGDGRRDDSIAEKECGTENRDGEGETSPSSREAFVTHFLEHGADTSLSTTVHLEDQ